MKNNTDKKNKNKIKKKWFLGTIIIFLVMSAFWGMFFWRAYESDGSTWTLRTLPNTPNVRGWTHWGQNGYAIVNKGNNKSYLYIYGEHYRSGSTSKPSVFKLNMLKWDNSKGFVHYKTIANGIYKNNRKRFYNGGDQALWKMENGVYAFQHQATIGGKSHTGDIDRSVTYSNWVSVGANENNKVALLYYDSKNKDSKLVIRSGQAKSKVQSVTANATDGIVLDIRGAMVIKASSQDSKDFDNGTQVAFDKVADLYHVKGDDSTSATGSTLYLRDADGKVHYSTHSGSEYKANETKFRYGKKNMKIPVSTLKDLPNGRYYLDYQISVKSGSQFSTSKDKSSLVAPSSSDLKSFKMKANDGYDRNYKIYETTGGNFGIHITDATPPTANTSQSPTSWTNRDVKLTVSGISDKGGSGYKRTTRPNGTTSTSTSVSQDVSSNGTYKFVIEDNDGNKTTKTFTVSNIDKTLPSVSFGTNGSSTYKRSHSTTVSVSDSGGSGVKTRQYAWSTSTTTPTSGWTNFNNGATLTTPTSTGSHYLHIKATDNAGNVRNSRSNAFRVDRTAPSGSISHSPTGNKNGNVTITVSGLSDSHSGYYQTRRPDGTYSTATSFNYSVSSNGTYEFVVYDKAGNTRTLTRTINNIDKTKPSISFSPNGNSTYARSHSVKATASDSGSGINTTQYAWTTNTTQPTNWTNFTNGGTLTAPTSTGNKYLWVRATDKAGNEQISRSNVFRIDRTAPTGSISHSPTGDTKGNVTITVSGLTDGHSGYYRTRRPNGTYSTSTSFNYTVSSNGTYEFVVYDNAGNTRTLTRTINNIDKTKPTISFSPNGNNSYQRSHSTKVTANDTGSGINTTQYVWSTSTTQPTSGWTNFTNGGTLTTPTSTGNHYLWIKATDKAGNEQISRSNAFSIDRNAPTGSISYSPTGWTNGNVTISLSSLTDSHSGYHQTKKPDGTYTTSTNFTYPVSANGTYEFVVYDKAGNTRTLSRTISNIDKTNPTVSFSPNGNSTYQQSHSTTVTVSDSGSGIKTSQYAWSTSNSTEPTNWTNFSSGNTLTTPSSDGNHYLWVKASDKAGNIKVLKSNVFRVDVTAPTHVSSSISGERYKSGKTYWVRPGDVLNVKLRQRDTLSGNQRGYIRVQGNSQDVRYFHSFGSSSTTHLSAVGSSFVNTSSVEVQGVKRTEHNTSNGYGTTEWEVKLNTSGHQYSVQYYHRDNASNNRGYVTVGTARVDGVAPNLSISPSTTSYTNKNITLTAKASDTLSGVKRIKKPNGSWVNASTATYTVSSNGTYTFVAEDNVGNQRTQIITISNIDKTAPTADLTQTPTSWTNGSVTLKLTNINDSGSGYYRTKLPDGSFVTSTIVNYTVTSNGTYSFVIYDNAGNSTTKSINVTNIDKVRPNATITYSTTAETRENVTVTIHATDDRSGVKSIRLPNGTILNQSTVSYTVSQNGSHSFVVTDYAGNSTTVTATVSNIDKTPPSLILFSSTEDWTNESIFVTAIASDNVGVRKIVLPNKSEVNGSRAIYTIEGNETYTFEVFDTVGNKTTKSIQITNFDNRVPTVNIETLNEMSNKIDVKLEYGDK